MEGQRVSMLCRSAIFVGTLAGVLGTAANPMSRDQLVAKCRDLISPVLGASQTGRLIDRVLAIDQLKDVRELRPLLQRTYRPGPPKLSEYPFAK